MTAAEIRAQLSDMGARNELHPVLVEIAAQLAEQTAQLVEQTEIVRLGHRLNEEYWAKHLKNGEEALELNRVSVRESRERLDRLEKRFGIAPQPQTEEPR